MTRPGRARSPHAHGPDEECSSCRHCDSCDGGSGRLPRTYRLHTHDTAVVITCTRCDGSGVTCLNLVKEPTP